MSLGSIVVATLATNVLAALYTFLGAFVYGVVYTVWLKRRTWLNIVIGGLAGSFAVLAGAAAVAPDRLDGAAMACRRIVPVDATALLEPRDRLSQGLRGHRRPHAAGSGGRRRAAQAIVASAALLVCASLVPAWYGLGWLYLVAALGGGAFFLTRSVALAVEPCRRTAMANFHASLVQLSLLLAGAIADATLLH